MNRLTLEIIKVVKNCGTNILFYKHKKLKDFLIDFLSKRFGCDKSIYTEGKINDIIFTSFCDYMETCDSPKLTLYEVREANKITNDIYEAMLASLQISEVCNGYFYVNGFDSSYENIEV